MIFQFCHSTLINCHCSTKKNFCLLTFLVWLWSFGFFFVQYLKTLSILFFLRIYFSPKSANGISHRLIPVSFDMSPAELNPSIKDASLYHSDPQFRTNGFISIYSKD